MKIYKSKTLKEYVQFVRDLEKDEIKPHEYGSMLILSLIEEIGEMSRAYLAEHGRKPRNLKAQQDETYKQELGDLLVSIIKLAIYKDIDLDERIWYTLKKIKARKKQPKV